MRRSIKKAWEITAVVLGTGLGVGFCPLMPGTIGSLWGIGLVWWLASLHLTVDVAVTIVFGLFVLGIPICAAAAKWFGRDDPGQIVFDEIIAIPLVFLAVPVTPATLILGFIWFRVFDIAKPFPIRQLDRLHGGFGVMIDDILAALYAAGALWLTVRLFGIS